GRDVRPGRRRGPARSREPQAGRPRASGAPQPVPTQYGGRAAPLREGARARDEPRPAPPARALPVPRRRDRIQPCPRLPAPSGRGGGGGGGPGGLRMSEGDGKTNDGNGHLTAKDFRTDQEVRWCPGCGDYAILAALQSFMPELGIERENTVFISGI